MDLLYRLVYIFIGSSSFVYLVCKIALNYWKQRGILHEKPNKPWGNLKGVSGKRHVAEVLQTLYEKYKSQAPFLGFYVWLKPMLLILDIDAINCILNKDSKNFMDRGLHFNSNEDTLSQNLWQMDGTEWQNFNIKFKVLQWREILKKTFPTLLKVQQQFDKSLEDKFNQSDIVCNITEAVESFNIDVIAALAFGLEGDSLRYKDTQFRKMCKNYQQENNNIYKVYLALCFPRLARLLRYRTYSLEATNYFQKLISDKLYEREYGNTKYLFYDFIQICYDSLKMCADKKKFESMATAQAFNFIPAGLDACTTTVSCCLYELALQPALQAKARQEIRDIMAKYYNKLTEEAIKEMLYLQQILNETLRKHTPYPFLMRITTKDYELPDSVFMLKKGNYLIIPTAAIHNDTTFYEYPEKFYPDHFHSTKVQNRPVCAFLPFSLGPRSCIFQYFVQQQMLLCLATLLNRYAFAPCQETVIPLTYDNTQILKKPKKDIKLMITKL